MSDQELIQALRVCAVGNCDKCSRVKINGPKCINDFQQKAADRIANQNTHILALQKEIEGLRAKLPRWIPVTERLPENGVKVLCWYEYFRYGEYNRMYETYGIGYQFGKSWGGEVAQGQKAKVLAWMPLPEPPEQEEM